MGKQRQFSEEVVLDQLANHFWKHGFSATKVDQLSKVTGLTKTSLYNAFGNKESLFLCSMNFYIEKSLVQMSGYLNKDQSLSKNLDKLLRDSFLSLDKKTLGYGCFLTNSIVELQAHENQLHEAVTTLCDKVWNMMLDFFSYYIDNGKLIGSYNAKELTHYYMTFWQGLRVQSRNSDASVKIENSIKLFLKFIKSMEK